MHRLDGGGISKAIVKGKGANLPGPPLGALTAQLVNGSVCLGAQFDTPSVVKNDAALPFDMKVEPVPGCGEWAHFRAGSGRRGRCGEHGFLVDPDTRCCEWYDAP